MDDESKQLLREIRNLQKEQLELLNATFLQPRLRFRFGLGTLLIVVTGAAVMMGLLAAVYYWRESIQRLGG